MINLGQLAREEAGRGNVVLTGFGTFMGTVIASREWGEQMERMLVPPAIAGSWDQFLHESNDDIGKNKLLTFVDTKAVEDVYSDSRGQRAIGVIYHPEYEAFGNYVDTILAERYDAFVFIDKTRALHPIHMPLSPDEEVPETFPTGV
jgi:erythromycin esterase